MTSILGWWAEIETESGAIQSTLKRAKISATGSASPAGAIVSTNKRVTINAIGTQTLSGVMGASIKKPTAAMSRGLEGAISASVKKTVAAVNARQTYSGAIGSALKKATAIISGSQAQSGTMPAALKRTKAQLYPKPYVVTSYGTSGEFTTATVSPNTGTIPSWGAQAGDVIMVCFNLTQKLNQSIANMPSGWFSPLGGSTIVISPNASNPDNLVVLCHVLTQAEVTADTRLWTFTNLLAKSSAGRRFVAVIRNADPNNPIDIAASANGASNSLAIADLSTPSRNGSLVLACGGTNGISTANTIGTPTAPWSSVGGTYSSGGSTRTVFIAKCATDTVAGVAFSGVNLTISNTQDWVSATVAFAPIAP